MREGYLICFEKNLMIVADKNKVSKKQKLRNMIRRILIGASIADTSILYPTKYFNL